MSTSLSARNVRVVRNGAVLLDDVSLEARAGELVAVLGPNGAGKSTLLGAIAGDFPLSSGAVEINGRSLADYAPRELARSRAVLPQQITISFPFTVREIVAMGRGPWLDDNDDERIAAALQRMDVVTLANRTYQTLSVGEQARVSMARVLAQDTPLLLLDEPTAVLDIGQQERFLAIARSLVDEGRAVVAVLHDLNVAMRYATNVVVLHEGRCVASGTPQTVLTPALLSNVYHQKIQVTTTADGRAVIL
ncbi:MAG: heme ABC transporter ATP-binding protein, partial [Acidimicrobiia bacterium]|nr:heme ABC transporter ATP-binding protein [Acidimicrobiia bacterium]